MFMRHATLSAALALCCVACGGPNFQFDAAAAPPWLRGAQDDGGMLREVGQATATLNVQRDAELATRDAQNRIAQRFASQVVSRSSDWAVAVATGDEQQSGQVVTQDIEIRTNVRVENTKVLSNYRDETTQTHYVLLGVDRKEWAAAVAARVSQGARTIATQVDEAERALQAKRALAALGILAEARLAGAGIEGDVLVLDMLQHEKAAAAELNALRARLASIEAAAKLKHAMRLEVRCSDAALAADVRRGVETFVKGLGFAVASRSTDGDLRIELEIDQRFVRAEKVANRHEQIHAAVGSIRVIDADGSEVGTLAVTLPGTSTERDVQAEAAKAKALKLAADTVAAQFRSRFRAALAGTH